MSSGKVFQIGEINGHEYWSPIVQLDDISLNMIYRDESSLGIYIGDVQADFDENILIDKYHPVQSYLEWRKEELKKHQDAYVEAAKVIDDAWDLKLLW